MFEDLKCPQCHARNDVLVSLTDGNDFYCSSCEDYFTDEEIAQHLSVTDRIHWAPALAWIQHASKFIKKGEDHESTK